MDKQARDSAWNAGNLVRLFRRRLLGGDLIQCGPALMEEAI
jgi:hypothetical protein